MDNFIQADIYTASQAIDGITGALTDYGITGFIISDSADFESFLADKNANWDYVDDELMGLSKVEPHITLYVHDNAQGAETLAAIRSLIESWKQNNSDGYYGNLRMELANVKEEDWANNWKKYYKPFRVGKTLVVKPSWEGVTPAAGDRILEIDPASTFGTGQHHTTKLVMEALEDIVKPGAKVLDLGCGTGALALLCWREDLTVTGLEIQQDALDLFRRSIERNRLENVTALHGDLRHMRTLLPHGSMDYVICNPPYFGRNTGAAAPSAEKRTARQDICCTVEEVAVAASFVLHTGGKAAFVFRPERLWVLLEALSRVRLVPKRLRFVHQNALAVPSAVLVECRKGGSAEGLSVEPPLLVESEEYLKIYGKTGSSD